MKAELAKLTDLITTAHPELSSTLDMNLYGQRHVVVFADTDCTLIRVEATANGLFDAFEIDTDETEGLLGTTALAAFAYMTKMGYFDLIAK